MKPIALIALAALAFPATATAQAQTPDAAVVAVIKRMFDGMREADSAKVRSVFAPGARFVTIGTRTNPDTITYEPVDGWIAAIARSNKAWDEGESNIKVQVDDNIAAAWMDFHFHLNGAPRHCGIDAVQLAKVRGEWKITQLADTRRTTCPAK
jgi:hypothetical protein